MLRAIIAAGNLLFCAACGQSTSSQATASTSPAAVTPQIAMQAAAPSPSSARVMPATPQVAKRAPASHRPDPLPPYEWQTELAKVMKATHVKSTGPQDTEFLATFNDGSKTSLSAYTRFQGGVIYWFAPSARSRHDEDGPSCVQVTVTLGKNLLPSLDLMPRYSAERSWFFLNHVTVVSDGKVVVDRNLPDVMRVAVGPNWETVDNKGHSSQYMRPDARVYRPREFSVFTPTETELAGLRRITKSSKLAIKLSGTNGEMTLPARDANAFREEIIQGLAIHDLLLRALRDRSA